MQDRVRGLLWRNHSIALSSVTSLRTRLCKKVTCKIFGGWMFTFVFGKAVNPAGLDIQEPEILLCIKVEMQVRETQQVSC